MSGLDKIVEQIIGEAEAAARKTVDEAKVEAGQIAEAAKLEGEKEKARLLEEAKRRAESIRQLGASAAELDGKRGLLRAKQQMIGSVIDQGKAALLALPDEDYFSMLIRLAQKNALPQEGELYLSQRDRDRMPSFFETKLNHALPEGAKLRVAKAARELDGGFILVYGDVEVNCSLSALFDAQRDALQDQVHQLLFS